MLQINLFMYDSDRWQSSLPRTTPVVQATVNTADREWEIYALLPGLNGQKENRKEAAKWSFKNIL